MQQKSILPWILAALVLLILWFSFGFMPGGDGSGINVASTSTTSTTSSTLETTSTLEAVTSTLAPRRGTFVSTGDEACTKDGKPMIRLFSTTWCSHCMWVKKTFDSVVLGYVNRSLVDARHWELDTYDDTLTPAYEGSIPRDELNLYLRFNSVQTVPTFVFGCKYYRVGNGHERENDLGAEESEFRDIIEELINVIA